MSNYASIEDLEMNPSKPITPMIIKNLVELINQEFNSQQTLYDAARAEKREQILEQYKQGVGFEKMLEAYEKAKLEVDLANKKVKEAQEKINLKGLTIEGEQYSPNYYGTSTPEQKKIKKACDKVGKLLDTANDQGPENIRNKIIARLWVAGTVGEAMVILRQVLGNGIIPSLSKSEVKLITN